jgi:hypothetical protein
MLNNIPTLAKQAAFNTKAIMLMLGRAILGEKLPTTDQDKIPMEYIAMYVTQDFFYAQARETAKNPEDLIKIISTATALKNSIQNAKAKTEYKLYLEQLEASIKKADEQLANQKILATTLDTTLPEWHKAHQENAQKLTRPGLDVNNPTMSTPIKNAFKLGSDLVQKWKEVHDQSEKSQEGMKNLIAATQAVLPTATAQVAPSKPEHEPPNPFV